MTYKLYLDDIRTPTQTYKTSVDSEWVIVRNYDEFVKVIERDGLPFWISFDHDLADEHYRQSMYDKDKHYSQYYSDGTFKEKTGYECAKWLVAYCFDKSIDLPKWDVHSMNPVGKQNIASVLLSYEKLRNDKIQFMKTFPEHPFVEGEKVIYIRTGEEATFTGTRREVKGTDFDFFTMADGSCAFFCPTEVKEKFRKK